MALAQTSTGGIEGTVADPSGAVVPNAVVSIRNVDTNAVIVVPTDDFGQFRSVNLPPANYQVSVKMRGFQESQVAIHVPVSGSVNVPIQLRVQGPQPEVVTIIGSGANAPLDRSSSTMGAVVSQKQIDELPLASRSFANIAYIAPMTAPVEPSDPTKARITAVAFAGSSGLNVDLSVDGGDNNDDFIGGFLQNYSPDAIQEFSVRTGQFDADASRTNGGSVIIATRAGGNSFHGGGGIYIRGSALNARNRLDNPEPNPKQPFSRQNYSGNLGGPIAKDKLWFFTALEHVHENASVAYGDESLKEFRALSALAGMGEIPGVAAIAVPSAVVAPYRDWLFNSRFDWRESDRSQWFFRFSLDRNRTQNDLLQQGTLPSTGATTNASYYSFLVNNQISFGPEWLGSFTFQGSLFGNRKLRNSQLGLALAFPFSTTSLTTSGFETFGDNQFVTAITAFPVARDQQKYQARYDLSFAGAGHAAKFGVNFIHEPVLKGEFSGSPARLVVFDQNPSDYLASGTSILPIITGTPVSDATNGNFQQNIRRLGLYSQDSWHLHPHLTVNYGLRYDTTFGLFRASGRNQDQNPALIDLRALGLPASSGIDTSAVPHDYRAAFAPRLGIVYSPGAQGNTVFRAGVGMYYNDLAQNGWAQAFQAVNEPVSKALLPGDPDFVPGNHAYLIDPQYHTPYALEASVAVEHNFSQGFRLTAQYEHQQGVHQYRRYEYVAGATLPATLAGGTVPDVTLFRSDNRSRYDGLALIVHHRGRRHEVTAHYTLAKATTYGATVGELFDYVNGVSDVRNPFGPGDHGPSGEDIRHRFVLSGTLALPYKFQLATLSQFESARPYTLSSPVDLNGDGIDTNDRAVVNGVQTSLDQFRGVPFAQVDLRVSRPIMVSEHVEIRPFVEFFNLFNRSNPGNNFVSDAGAFPVAVDNPANITALCSTAATCRPIHSFKDLRFPGGALGDFFGPGSTVGIPFAAQLGIKVSF